MTDQNNQRFTPSIDQTKAWVAEMERLKNEIMQEGVDYGAPFPGNDKPVLLKPGGELIVKHFGLAVEIREHKIIRDLDRNPQPYFYAEMEAVLKDQDGRVLATGFGSCNTEEDRYKDRWIEGTEAIEMFDKSDLEQYPKRIGTATEFDFVIKRLERGEYETTGRYGKPKSYWDAWLTALHDKPETVKKIEMPTRSGTKPGYQREAVYYRVPNPIMPNVLNTVLSMASKRAFLYVVRVGTAASRFFTQDEDYRDALTGENMPGIAAVGADKDKTPIKSPYDKPDWDTIPQHDRVAFGEWYESTGNDGKQAFIEYVKTNCQIDPDWLAFSFGVAEWWQIAASKGHVKHRAALLADFAAEHGQIINEKTGEAWEID